MGKWSDGQSEVTGPQIVSMLDYSQICFSFSQCKHVRQTFDGILLSTPLLIIIYKGKQGAEAYLRVSPKQEIKMTVTHPLKVKKNIYIKNSWSLHFSTRIH